MSSHVRSYRGLGFKKALLLLIMVSVCWAMPAFADDAAKKTQSVAERLVGGWEMVDWKLVKGDKLLDPPQGSIENLGGVLIYSKNGMMSAFLSVKNNPKFKNDSLDGGTPEEKIRALDNITAYTGSYTVDEATSSVHHKVMYSSFPNFVGSTLTRICIFENDTMKLDTPPMEFGGEKLGSYILWRKIK